MSIPMTMMVKVCLLSWQYIIYQFFGFYNSQLALFSINPATRLSPCPADLPDLWLKICLPTFFSEC
jgi:hypothetical protein